MKKNLYLVTLLLPATLLAQSNYIANTPNSATPSNANTFIGPESGNSTLTGDRNSIVGFRAGSSLTSGNRNTFLGMDAGKNAKTGIVNVMIGWEAGLNTDTGNSNVLSDLGRVVQRVLDHRIHLSVRRQVYLTPLAVVTRF
ncbi:hypothetical protein [Spirosoma horti]